MYYLETNSTDPYFNLAFEEYVLLNKTQRDILILWQNDNTIVVGQNQNTLSEINESFVKENNIKIIRRKSGGGAVYHDMGNINFSFITDKKDDDNLDFLSFTLPIVSALKGLDLDVNVGGRNDIFIGDKKVSGTAQRIYKNRVLFHGTLLFDSDLSILSKALNPDNTKFIGKASKSVRSRVGNIRDNLASDMCTKDFFAYLKKSILAYYSKEKTIFDEVSNYQQPLSDDEINAVMEISKKTYSTYEWNFAKSPRYEISKKKRFLGGTVEVTYSVNKGKIEQINFYGDFLSKSPLDLILNVLIGTKYERAEILKILNRIPDFEDYFGSVSVDEILDLLF